jgi:hypothetical protein
MQKLAQFDGSTHYTKWPTLHAWAQSGSLFLLTINARDDRNSEESGHYTDTNFNLDPILEAAIAIKLINSQHTPTRLSRRGPIRNIMNMVQMRSTYSTNLHFAWPSWRPQQFEMQKQNGHYTEKP